MRIIAGTYRGRRLNAPAGRSTRPTTDRVRESLMSTIASARCGFEGACVWDAFAGSGALGYEALSRGAAYACLTDNDPSALRVLRQNAEALGMGSDVCRIQKADSFKALPPRPCALGAQNAPAVYDLVFFDPPYAVSAEEVREVLLRLEGEGLLADGALISYEHASEADSLGDSDEQHPLSGKEGAFALATHKRFGDTGVDLFRYRRRTL